MQSFFESSAYFGLILSLLAYGIGSLLKRRIHSPLCNPLLIAAILTALFLLLTGTDYQVYYTSAHYLSYLLTPATICLAIPLYEDLEILKKNYKAIFIGISSGVLCSLLCIFVLSLLFGLEHSSYVTLLPKSITTAIGISLSAEMGGNAAITTAAICITGMSGNFFALSLCRLLKITEPIARGVAIGTASHAMGTVRAFELGETEGAVSSLSIVIAGILTVFLVPFFAPLL